jgi:GTPase SAR1 family protein
MPNPTPQDAATPAQVRRCKIVAIGDASVGKTCMMYSYAHKGEFLSEHVPTLFNNFEANIEVEDGNEKQTVNVSLWDTAGQEEFDEIRQKAYGNTGSPTSSTSSASNTTAGDPVNVFLVCFAWNNPQSYTSVEMKWYKDIRRVAQEMNQAIAAQSGHKGDSYAHQPMARPFSVILVGTKYDLAKEGARRQLSSSDAELLRRKIGADALVNCSSKSGEGIHDVFNRALTAWYEKSEAARLEKEGEKDKKGRGCSIQ